MNILVVDDEPALRQLIRRCIEREFNVGLMEADDGLTALDRLLKDPVDLVLLDLSMKVMGGIETLEAIRRSETFSHLPVVLMTALADEHHVRRAMELGIAGFIVKPFTPVTLRDRLATIIQEGQRAARVTPPTARFLDIEPSHRALIVDQSREFRAIASRQISRLCVVDEAENEFIAMKRCVGGQFDLLIVGATSELSTAGSLARKVREMPGLRRIRLVAAVAPDDFDETAALGLFDAVVVRSFVDETFDRSLYRALSQNTLARLLFHPTSPCLDELWAVFDRKMARWLGAGVAVHETPQTPSGDARWAGAAIEIQGGNQAWELRVRLQYALALEICRSREPALGDRISEQQIAAVVGRCLAEIGEEFRPLLLGRGLTARTFPPRVTLAGTAQLPSRLKNTDSRRWLVTARREVVPIELASISSHQANVDPLRGAGLPRLAPAAPITTR